MTNIYVLSRAICEAYARNSGNNLKEHFNTRAATIWMQQALDEVGVVDLIDAAEASIEFPNTGPSHTMLMKAIARVGGSK